MIDTVLLAATVTSVLTLLIFVMRPPALMSIAFLLWALNFTWFTPSGVGAAAVVGGLLFAFVAGFKSRADVGEPRRVAPIAYVPVVAGVVGLAMSASSYDASEAMSFSAMAILLGLVALYVARTIPGPVVVRAGFYALTALVVVSAGASVAGLEDAVVNDRWVGITPNPNTLGFLAALWVATSFAFSRKLTLLVAPLGLLLAMLSGSRGGSLAVLAGLAAGLWAGGLLRPGSGQAKWPQRLLLLGSMAVLAWAVAGAVTDPRGSDGRPLILRQSDSGRLDLTESNWELFLTDPWLGQGFGVVSEYVGGAHFAPVVYAVQLGILGLLLFAATVFLLLKTKWRTRPALAALIFAGLVETIAEAWLFGAGSVLTGIFWFSVAALATDPVWVGPADNRQPRQRGAGQTLSIGVATRGVEPTQ